MPPHWQRGWDAPSANAQQKNQIQTHVCAVIGAVFFWFYFLCPHKENELGCPAETGLNIQHRDSDSNKT